MCRRGQALVAENHGGAPAAGRSTSATSRVEPMQRRRGRRTSLSVRGGADCGDHFGDVPTRQITEPDPAEMRNQMPLDMDLVATQHGRPDSRAVVSSTATSGAPSIPQPSPCHHHPATRREQRQLPAESGNRHGAGVPACRAAPAPRSRSTSFHGYVPATVDSPSSEASPCPMTCTRTA